MQKVLKVILQGTSWIPHSVSDKLRKFQQILPELTITGNGIILKGNRIVLPEILQNDAIKLAHCGSHPGISGVERRLRYHFFFHDLQGKVQKLIQDCSDCNVFSDKKTTILIKAHTVPAKCWETVAVDLFGPMPSSKHMVVVQDLSSRYPVAKLVTSTRAQQVIPAMAEIYDSYGNPSNQLSDSGPPFNSKAMPEFADRRDITLQKTPPMHPSANPVETFMKPLGKAMTIANHNQLSEKDTLSNFLTIIGTLLILRLVYLQAQ